MEIVKAYQIFQCLNTLVFMYFISDFRRKITQERDWYLDKKFTVLMRVCYPLPVFIYLYTLMTFEQVFITDYLASCCTILGTSLIIKAKHDLGELHLWAGWYYPQLDTFIVHGIYSWIRHPLYVGIYITIIGVLLTVVPHAHYLLSLIIFILYSYIGGILALSAVKETQKLSEQFGHKFLEYKKQVHPFLPIRKFTSE